MSSASDREKYLNSLDLSIALREPVIREIVASLQLSSGSKGLDAGCGNGFFTMMLAEAVGASGRVTGLDREEEFLESAKSSLQESGLRERVSFKSGDLTRLPFDIDSFDWALSIDCIGLIEVNPILLIKELSRIVKPGGMIFILSWSSQMLLPGYPALEARLNATASGLAPFTQNMNPSLHNMRAVEWFQQVGLSDPKARTFVRDIYSPLNISIRKAMFDLFEMRWGKYNPELSKKSSFRL